MRRPVGHRCRLSKIHRSTLKFTKKVVQVGNTQQCARLNLRIRRFSSGRENLFQQLASVRIALRALDRLLGNLQVKISTLVEFRDFGCEFFRHVEFLQQMGAHIAIDGRSAVINGPARLHGTRMSIPDIRSGAALVIAGLCAEGVTELDRVFHLERGYDDLEVKLAGLGADIERAVTDEPSTEVRDLTGVVGD